jgi:polyisoprenoid-binding protein YceI
VALKLGERIMSETRFVTAQAAGPGRAAASEQDVLLASSLLNTAQQVGGSTGLAALGTVAWTVVANSVHAQAARTAAATSQSAHQGGRLAATAHQHGLTTGFSRAFLVAAGIAVLNRAMTIAAIRVRRTDLTGAPHPVTTEPAGQTPQSVRCDKETTMREPSGQVTAPALQALLKDGALAGEWVLDPRKSSIRLKSKAFGLPVTGVFREITGNGTVSASGEVSGTVTVAAASIDTKNTRRDTHLRSADFFDTGNHPDLTVMVDGIRPSDRGAAVTGALTVRGVTRPLSFDVAASVPDDGEVWLDAEVHVNRADFGLTWNLLGTASMHNTLIIHAVFTRR